MIAITPFI